jgi:diguanylate cyclase (GGDEF)-like protein
MVARKIVNSMQIEFQLTERSLRVTTSIGVAMFSGGDVDSHGLMAKADAALYQAKATGRNTYQIAA